MIHKKCVQNRDALLELLHKIKRDPQFTSLGFVPTMGALHHGHQSLIKKACEENSHVIVSVFVNPKQFGQHEDFGQYPRQLEKDCQCAIESGADFVFAPDMETIYPSGFCSAVRVPDLYESMCGLSRPGHFDGVCTVVSILFNLIGPNKAYFGLKDYQQVAIIKKMVKDLSYPIIVQECPIFREQDGLAASSRNVYLNEVMRKNAQAIPASLFHGAGLYFDDGTRDAKMIGDHALSLLTKKLSHIDWELDYLGLYNPETLKSVENGFDSAVLAIAVRLPGIGDKQWVRLIDNIRLFPEDISDLSCLRDVLS